MNKVRSRFGEESTNIDMQQSSARSSYGSDLCVILTEKCNIRCRHCISSCSPSRTEDLDWANLDAFIRQAGDSSFVNSIGFSGGEPFMDIPRLETAVTLCREHGLAPTVTTNGFWAHSVTAAKDVLKKMKSLIQVCLSTDVFHQEFIPVDRIVNAIKACDEFGIHCAVVVTHLKDNQDEAERIRRQLHHVDGLFTLQQWPVLNSGRARFQIKKDDLFTYDLSNSVCVSADTPTLNANGELTACCGPAGQWPDSHRLSFGHLNDRALKETIEIGDQDPIVQALRVWGPARLLDLAMACAAKKGITLDIPAAIDICTICEYLFTDVERTTLVERSLQEVDIMRELVVTRMARLGEVSMFLNLIQAGNPRA